MDAEVRVYSSRELYEICNWFCHCFLYTNFTYTLYRSSNAKLYLTPRRILALISPLFPARYTFISRPCASRSYFQEYRDDRAARNAERIFRNAVCIAIAIRKTRRIPIRDVHIGEERILPYGNARAVCAATRASLFWCILYMKSVCFRKPLRRWKFGLRESEYSDNTRRNESGRLRDENALFECVTCQYSRQW